MQLVEKTIIKKTHPAYQELDQLSFRSKNLYNAALYVVRQEFFKTKKLIGACQLFTLFKNANQPDYVALPRKVSMQVLFQVEEAFKSFFKALKAWRINPEKFLGRPKIPGYKDKIDGRNILTYDNQAISKKPFKKKGLIHLSQTRVFIPAQKVNLNSLAQVQVVPRYGHYVICAIYNVPDPIIKEQNNQVAAIDLGIDTLAALTFSEGSIPQLINGKPLKAINQYYNKKKGLLQSQLTDGYTSNRIEKLTLKRKNKIDDYMHKASRYIVNQLVSKEISLLIIGYNQYWKQETNIGKRNNQNFVCIPFLKFVDMLTYKCQLEGINVILNEESYTSKCSFLDLESIEHHEEYLGKRIKRGMFRSSSNKKINADINGSYNIMRKVVPNIFDKGIEGIAVYPLGLKSL